MDNTAPLLFERSLGVCGYLYREDGYAKYDTLMRKCASLAVDKAGVEEEMRILYVALTRAKQKMIVTASVKDAKELVNEKVKGRDCISEYSVLKASSHIDWIVGAWATDMSVAELHVIEGEAEVEKILDTKENKLYYDKAEVEKIEKILRERFDFSYEYEYLDKLPSKLSVSDLYPKVLDNEENSEIEQNISIDIMPDFLTDKEKGATAAEKGTSTHLFMQFCDFNNLKTNGSKAELDRLYENSYISERVKELVNLKHIDAFAKSELFSELLSAKRVIREFRFNVMLPSDEFTEDERLNDEKVLVQGVTDCIFENEAGELILVDYKTDRVTNENYVEELTLRHKNQLTYYKKACEMMFERSIDRVIIYSVPLAKNVEVKI
jgi:ATP-dependent helicase/nuclease subunit A